jgi:small-conductance mechanosensitive channel
MNTTNIILIVLLAVIAVAIGLALRLFLVRRLKRTILDNWIVQLLGVVVFVLPLIGALFTLPFLLQNKPIIDNITTFLNKYLSEITNFAWQAFLTVVAIVVGVAVGRTVMKIIVISLASNRVDINLRVLIGNISFILIMIVDVLWILAIWHVAIDLPVVVLGAVAVTFTVAFQDILKNLVAGFYILVERPFHIGDSITIGNAANEPMHTGLVENIVLRATKLRISSGEQITVPNALIFGGIVINNSFYAERRVTINVNLPVEAFAKEETLDLIVKTLKEMTLVKEKVEPTAIVSGYTETQVVIMVSFWVEDSKFASISEVMYTLRTVLPDAALSLVESTSAF